MLTLKEPFGLVMTALASCTTPLCFMMPKKDAETDPFQQITGRIGSGPFTFNQSLTQPGSKYVYDKWDKYVPRKRTGIGPGRRQGGAARSGDLGEYRRRTDRQRGTDRRRDRLLRAAAARSSCRNCRPIPDIKLQVLNPTGNDGICRLNWLYPPFDNVKARQAMLYLIDQKAILNATFGNPKYYNP